MDTTLQLGDFVFEGMEVPESIQLGGSQVLVKHRFPGGAKHVQALGPEEGSLTWRGLMLGEGALDRAKFLDFLRKQGNPLPLTLFDSTYTVVIERFEYTVERFYKIPFVMTVEVVSDDSQPVTDIVPSGFDAGISDDVDSMGGLGDLIGDGPLSSAIGAVSSAVSAVGSFASAGASVISGVLGTVAAVSARVTTLTAQVTNTINSVGTLGGILPNAPLAQQTGNMLSQVAAAAQYPLLLNLTSITNRLARNVGMASQIASTQTLQVAGGNLFDIAAAQYGDATLWPAIAKASGVTEMLLTGVNTLKIPANPQPSGGVPLQ